MSDKKQKSKSGVWLILTSITSAVAATLCCLPALLFLLFGTSFSALSVFEPLGEYRTYFSVFAVCCFGLSLFFTFFKRDSCAVGACKKRWYLIYVLVAILLVFLLAYPEILGSLYA